MKYANKQMNTKKAYWLSSCFTLTSFTGEFSSSFEVLLASKYRQLWGRKKILIKYLQDHNNKIQALGRCGLDGKSKTDFQHRENEFGSYREKVVS